MRNILNDPRLGAVIGRSCIPKPSEGRGVAHAVLLADRRASLPLADVGVVRLFATFQRCVANPSCRVTPGPMYDAEAVVAVVVPNGTPYPRVAGRSVPKDRVRAIALDAVVQSTIVPVVAVNRVFAQRRQANVVHLVTGRGGTGS